jgi:CHAD domain-containing protein
MATGQRIEVEAKYSVGVAGSADGYLVAPDIGGFAGTGPVRSIRIEDRYVDSPDWALARAGFAARLRRTAEGTEISLKARQRSSGKVHRREEIEGPADAGLIAADWPASPARTVVMELCGDQALVPFLTIRQIRRVRRIEAGEARAELSVDEVEILHDGKVLDRFVELEVELKRGEESALDPVLAELDRTPGLSGERASKLEHALEALSRERPDVAASVPPAWLAATAGSDEPRPEMQSTPGPAADDPTGDAPARSGPRAIGIQAADTRAEAARKILEFHFRRMRNRESGVLAGARAEDLHEMRVAVRRMRAAWRIFEGSFKASRTKKIRRRLEVLADQLGSVRDLDVLIAGLDAYRLGLDESQRPGLDPLAAVWRRERADLRKALVADLGSPSYAAFVKEMEVFLESGANAAAAVPSPTSPHRVKDCAASRIWSSFEAVRVYELVLPWADVETLHSLRIEAKWLRYSLEFFLELLGPDGPRLLERVVALQDHLGLLHDADVAAKLVRDVLVSRAGELGAVESDTIGAFLHSRERELARRRRALGPVWRAVNGAPFRRGLGRATASL